MLLLEMFGEGVKGKGKGEGKVEQDPWEFVDGS